MLEVSITPNRGDCLSVLGLAREVAALAGGRLRVPAIPDHLRDHQPTIPVSVEILDPVSCPRYSARLIHGLRPAPSPPWLRFRLEACGIRSINHIVDVTNYVMLETGQPLHAFDARQITSRRIVVRTAGEAGTLTTLDGSDRALHPDDLLICDGDTPAALAGVMGGAGSEVTDETESVLLESAHFDPLTIRRTAKRMGMHTEASHRFERGVDPDGTRYAMDRAVALWEGMGEARVVPGFADAYPGAREPAEITLRYASVKRALGVELARDRIRAIIESLGIELKRSSDRDLVVSPPSYRFDLTREADIVEELARVHGYDNIPATLPAVKMGVQGDPLLRWLRKTRSLLTAEGLSEVVTLPFCSAAMNRTFPGLWGDDGHPVRVTNPLRQETDEMRLSLLPGLVENLHYHSERRGESSMIFELEQGVFARTRRRLHRKDEHRRPHPRPPAQAGPQGRQPGVRVRRHEGSRGGSPGGSRARRLPLERRRAAADPASRGLRHRLRRRRAGGLRWRDKSASSRGFGPASLLPFRA